MKVLRLSLMLTLVLAFMGCNKKQEVAPAPASSAPLADSAPAGLPPATAPSDKAASNLVVPAPAVTLVQTPPALPAATSADLAAVPPPPTVPASQAAPLALPVSTQNTSSDQIADGLKEALGKGLQRAIAELGKENGFLTNLNVRIPIPDKIQRIETAARAMGEGKLADEFILTLNRAAEQAVPTAATVFSEGLTKMTIQDAQGILQGPNDAATQFFRRTTEAQLREKFLPIVKGATAKTGVTAAYKQLMGKAAFASAFLGKDVVDLDGYVTTKALDGLFLMVADEEKRIRENPVARTTEVLKSVFGALRR